MPSTAVEAGDGNVRKSSRKRASRSFFVAGASKRISANVVDENDEDWNKKVGERANAAGRKGPATRGKKKRGKALGGSSRKSSEMGELFAALCDRGVSVTQVARDLLGEGNASECGTKLFLLLAECGGAGSSTAHELLSEGDTEALDCVTDDEKVAAWAAHVAARGADEGCFSDDYPLGGDSEAAVRFSNTFKKFWSLLLTEDEGALLSMKGSKVLYFIVELLERLSAAPLLSMRHTAVVAAQAVGNGLLSLVHAHFAKLERTLKQLMALVNKQSNSEELKTTFNPFRKAAQLFCLPGAKAFKRSHVDAAEKAWLAACNSSVKGKAKAAVHQITKTCLRVLASTEQAGELLQILWDSVLCKRCLDINPVVRVAAVEAVTSWSVLDRARFVPRAKVLIERLFRDKQAFVRIAAARAFADCMCSQGGGIAAGKTSKNALTQPYLSLAERDLARLNEATRKEQFKWARRAVDSLAVEMLRDKNPDVAQAAAQALSAVQQFDSSLISTPILRRAKQYLCEPGIQLRPLRLAVAALVQRSMDLSGDTVQQDDDNNQEDGAGSVVRARLQLSSFVDIVSSLAGNHRITAAGLNAGANTRTGNDMELEDEDEDDVSEEEGDVIYGETGTRFEQSQDEKSLLLTLDASQMFDVVDAFWSLPESKGAFLRNWSAACAVLEGYGQSDSAGAVGEHKARIVSGIIRAAAERASASIHFPAPNADSGEKLTRKEKKSREDIRENALEALHATLIQRLAGDLTTFKHDATILHHLAILAGFLDPTKCTKDIERRALSRIVSSLVSTIATHSDPGLILAAAQVVAKRFCFGEEHPLQREFSDGFGELENKIAAGVRRCAKDFLRTHGDGKTVHKEMLSSLEEDDDDDEDEDGTSGRDEALVALTNMLRRAGALLRISDDAESTLADEAMCKLVADSGLALSKVGGEMKPRALSALSEALLFLQLDFMQAFYLVTQALAIAVEKTPNTAEQDADLRTAITNALLKRDRLATLLGQVAKSSSDGAALAVAMPTYHELRLLCTTRLLMTDLHALAWDPPAALERAVAQRSIAVVQDELDSAMQHSDALFLGRTARCKAVLEPAYKAERFASKESSNDLNTFLISTAAFVPAMKRDMHHSNAALIASRLNTALKTENPERWAHIVLKALQSAFLGKERTVFNPAETGIKTSSEGAAKVLAKRFGAQLSARKHTCPARLGAVVAKCVGDGLHWALQNPDRIDFLSALLPLAEALRKPQLDQLREAWIRETADLSRPVAAAIFSQSSTTCKPFAAFEKELGVTTKPSSHTVEEGESQQGNRDMEDTGSVESDASAKEIGKNLFESDDNESLAKKQSLKRSSSLLRASQNSAAMGKPASDDALFQESSALGGGDSGSDSDSDEEARPKRIKR